MSLKPSGDRWDNGHAVVRLATMNGACLYSREGRDDMSFKTARPACLFSYLFLLPDESGIVYFRSVNTVRVAKVSSGRVMNVIGGHPLNYKK